MDDRDADGIADDINARLAALGHPCCVRVSPNRGLAMYATRDISAGEVVITERPVVCTPCDSARPFACAACFADSRVERPKRGVEARWPRKCAGCRTLRFCSEACEASLASRHRDSLECQVLAAIAREEMDQQRTIVDSVNASLLGQAIRLLSDRHAGMRVSVFAHEEPPSSLHLGFDDLVHRLVAVRRSDEWRACIEQAADAALRFVPESARVPRDGLYDALSRHQANVYAVCSRRGRDVARACFAGAMHLFNHSCAPCLAFDSVPIIQGGGGAPDRGGGPAGDDPTPSFSLVSLIDVAAGGELTISYTGVYDEAAERRAHLAEYYGFVCDCTRCAAGDDGGDDAFDEARPRCNLDEDCGTGYAIVVGEAGQRRCVHCGRLCSGTPSQRMQPASSGEKETQS